MAWSLAAIFSISSIASSGVFNLKWDCKPSMKMLSWTGLLNPCVGVFWSNLWKRSRASLSDSWRCWWKDEISTFPSMVLDFRKYFFRNFSTTSFHVHRLFPLNKWSHLFASPAKEKENKLRWMASSGTPAIFTVLQILMYVARCAYGFSLGKPWNKFPWINRTFSWEWCFLVGTLALSVVGLFLFCFCLAWDEQVNNAQDFGWAIKGRGPL